MTTTPVSTQDTTKPIVLKRHPLIDTTQFAVLILIVLLVGFMAGAASFNHVKTWTLDNSPDGTDAWFGWANAVISELIPTAAIIEIGRRRRRDSHASVRYPMVLLFSAVGFSLTAQLAVAKPGVSGWAVSALPALAFLGLSKLVFSATSQRPTTDPVAAPAPATSPATSSDTTRVEVSPAPASKTRATTPAKKAAPAKKTPAKRTPAKKTTAPAAATTAPAEIDQAPAPAPAAPTGEKYGLRLLDSARTIATSHHDEHGEPIRPNQLAVRLRVPTTVASDLLTHIDQPTEATTRPHNGSTVTEVNA